MLSLPECVFCHSRMRLSVKGYCKCMKCGLYRKVIIPQRDKIYHNLRNKMLSATKNKEKFKGRMANAVKQVEVLNGYVDEPGQLYDVGAAAGFFMFQARLSGWLVRGNEVSRKAIQYANAEFNLNIDFGQIEDLHIESRIFDAVVLWNSLEHVINPRTTLKKCENILKSKGLLYMEVPLKRNDVELDQRAESGHFSEFNYSNLTQFLNGEGFEVIFSHETEKPDKHINLDILYRKVK